MTERVFTPGYPVEPSYPNTPAKRRDPAHRAAFRNVVAFGDSRLAQNDAFTGGHTYELVKGLQCWVKALCGQRVQFINKAVGGNTTVDLLNRMTADLDGLDFDYLLLMCDVNDIAVLNLSYAEITANYQRIYNYARSRGARVIHIAPYAPGASGAWSVSQCQTLLQLRQWILNAQWASPWVTAIDSFSLISTATASPPTTANAQLSDPSGAGLHWGGSGVQPVAAAIAAIFVREVPEAPSLLASAADNYGVDSTRALVNLFDNGLMAGTGGTLGTGAANATAWVTATAYAAGRITINAGNCYLTRLGGTSGATAPVHTAGTASDGTVLWEFVGSGAVAGVAAGLTVSRASGAGTAYCCTVNRADGLGKDQVFAVVGAAADEIWYFADPATGVPGRAVNGAYYVGECELAVLGAVGLNAPSLRLLTTTNGTATNSHYMGQDTPLYDSLVRDSVLHQRMQPAQVPTTGAVSVFTLQNFMVWGAAGRGCFKVGRMSLRRVS